jgi:hypothetical protein
MIGIPLGLPAQVLFRGPILELVQPPLMFAGLAIGMFRSRVGGPTAWSWPPPPWPWPPPSSR